MTTLAPRGGTAAVDVEVRVAGDADLERIGELTLLAYDRLADFSEAYRDQLGDARLRHATEAVILVALVEGEVAGSMALSLGPTEMFEHRFGVDGDSNFRMLAVDPAFEGRGIGRALVAEAIARAEREGCRRMVITSMDMMDRAHGLYERFGFVRRPDLDVRFPSGIGMIFTLDLVPDAADHFPAPGPVPPQPRWYLDDPDVDPVACT